jgi:hypothetical protein
MKLAKLKFSTVYGENTSALLTAKDELSFLTLEDKTIAILPTYEGTLIEVINMADLVGINDRDKIRVDGNGRIIKVEAAKPVTNPE